MLKYINDNYKLTSKLSKQIFNYMVEINYKDSKLEKALDIADLKIIELLIKFDLKKKVIYDFLFKTNLYFNNEKSETDFIKMLKIFIKNDVDIHFKNEYMLRFACMYGSHDIVKFLLKNGADIHYNDDEALRCASGLYKMKICELLLKNGADKTKFNQYGLEFARRYNVYQVTRFFKS